MFNSFSNEDAGQPLGSRRPLIPIHQMSCQLIWEMKIEISILIELFFPNLRPMTRVVNKQETKNLIFTLNKKI